MRLVLLLTIGAVGLLCLGRAMDRNMRDRKQKAPDDMSRWEDEGGATPTGPATQSAPNAA